MIKKYLTEIEKNNKKGKKINAILQVNKDISGGKGHRSVSTQGAREPLRGPKILNSGGKLSGRVIVVKANINVKGLNISCASKTLEDYKAPYDATVVKKIKNEGGIILGMANMDEFAQGSSGETSAFGPTKNPVALDLVPGGTSSGCAAALAAGFCEMALGSDTGGSVRTPASHCGVVGVKPTYSSVSRYGLIDSAMSFDQIGPMAKNVSDAALLLNVIMGKDENDSISQKGKGIDLKKIEQVPKNLKIGVLDFKISDERIQKLIDDQIKKASEKYGWKVEKIKIPYIDLALATYYPIQYVEFFSATRRFDGRRYGKKIEDVCGPEVLRRIFGGGEISKAEHSGRYYYQALKARKLIEDEFRKAFRKFDCIISPTVPRLPHKIGEKISVKDMYYYDALTVPANIVGCCAVSVPVGTLRVEGMKEGTGKSGEVSGGVVPVGLQIMCDRFCDERMLQIGRAVEKLNERGV